MVCAGYSLQGIFSYLLGIKGDIKSSAFAELPWTNDLVLRELVFTESQDLLVIGEQYHFYKDNLIDSDGEAFVSYRNQYGYILVANFSISNNEKWVQTIPKIQVRR